MRAALMLLPLALVAAAGPQRDRPMDPATQAKLDKALVGYIPGAPTSCIPITYRSLNTRTFGSTLLYQEGSGPIYRNDTAGGCEGAARGDILVQVEQEGRPCQGDIIRTVDQVVHSNTGSCALGQFVPYTKVKPAR